MSDMTLSDKQIKDTVERAKAAHEKGDLREAVRLFGKVCPLKEYEPFVYQYYGDALERLEMPEKALEMYRLDLKAFDESGEIPSEEMLDGSFQKALLMEIQLDPAHFAEDFDLYLRFLEKADTSDRRLKHYIADTIVLMSRGLPKKWVRVKFRQLLNFVEERGIFDDFPNLAVSSGYFSVEYHDLVDDEKVSRFVADYFSNVSEELLFRQQVALSESTGQDKPERSETDLYKMKAVYLAYNYYMCRYFGEHSEEMAYIKETYPHVWELAKEELGRIGTDKESFKDELVEGLLKELEAEDLAKEREKLIADLDGVYERAVTVETKTVRPEGTQRFGKQIGRNDPCPCGSGKKYKNCCGR